MPGCARSRVADDGGQVVDDRVRADAERLRDHTHGAGVHTGDDHTCQGVGSHVGCLARIGKCRLRDRNVRVLTEALFPHVRRRLAGKAPPVQELQRRGTPPEHSGLIGRTVGRERERNRTIATIALVGSPGSAGADVREDDERRLDRVGRQPDRAGARPRGTTEVVRADGRVEAERGVNRGRVRLLEVRRTGGGEQHTPRRERSGETRQRVARGLHTQRRRVLVVGRDGTRPGCSRRPERRGDRAALEPALGEIDARGDESHLRLLHVRDHAPRPVLDSKSKLPFTCTASRPRPAGPTDTTHTTGEGPR